MTQLCKVCDALVHCYGCMRCIVHTPLCSECWDCKDCMDSRCQECSLCTECHNTCAACNACTALKFRCYSCGKCAKCSTQRATCKYCRRVALVPICKSCSKDACYGCNRFVYHLRVKFLVERGVISYNIGRVMQGLLLGDGHGQIHVPNGFQFEF